MFDNSRFFDMDEALIRVLNLLANVADFIDVEKYVFDSTNYTFHLKRQQRIGSSSKLFASRVKNQSNKTEVNWQAIALVGFASSNIILILVIRFAPKDSPQALLYLPLFCLLVSIVVLLVSLLVKSMEGGKEPGRWIINKAVEDIIAYQPVIREIYAVAQNNQKTLTNAGSIIKNLIEEIQVREKKYSFLLSIMFFGFIILAIWFIFPVQLFENTSLNDILTPQNIAIAIGVTGTFVIPIIKSFIESGSQSQILKLRKCLFLLEQAQARADHIGQQVIPVESTKLRPQFGSAKGLIEMSDDFDDPLTDFDDYMP